MLYPLSHFVTAPPEWEPRGTRDTDCDRRESPEGAAPVQALVRNDMVFSFNSEAKNRVPKNRDAAEICAIQAISP